MNAIKPFVRRLMASLSVLGLLLLTGCPTNAPAPRITQILHFTATPNPVPTGSTTRLSWHAVHAASAAGALSCSLVYHLENAPEPTPAVEVSCQGTRDITVNGRVSYQLNVLNHPYVPGAPDAYLTQSLLITTTEAPQPVTVTLTPATANLQVQQSRSFTVTVTGTSDTRVTWTTTCGTITGSGHTITYAAPNSPGTCSLSATSVAAPWSQANATITITGGATPEPIAVTVQPPTATLEVNESRSFTATITGTSDTRVTWDASCGSFVSIGNPATYVAPASAGPCTVTATSVADGSASASANVTVVAPEPVEVMLAPTNATLETGDLLSLTAAVSGTTNTAVSWSASCGTIVTYGASSASFTAPAAPGSCTVTATSVADPTKHASAVIYVILSQEALSATITRAEVVRSAYPYPGGTSDPFGFGERKTTSYGRCGFDFYGGFGVSDSAGDHRWMCLDWSAQAGSWESALSTLLEVRTPSGVTLCTFAFSGTARSARVDLSGCSTAPSETVYARVGRDDGSRIVFGPLQPLLVLPLITAERPAENAYFLLVNTFQFEWAPQVPLPASAELQLRMYDVVQDAPGSLPSRGTAWSVYYDIDPSNVTALINTVPVNDGSHYRWFMRAEVVVDSISVSYSVSDKYRLCRAESSGSSANCSFAFTGPD